MLDAILLILLGMLIGWNLLPQPAWVRRLWEKMIGYFRSERG